jgi:hypothetical protein
MSNEDFSKYYKLKSQYEMNWAKQKKKVLTNDDLSKREKREKIKLLKPNCISCKNPGGTIFSMKYDSEERVRFLSAKCGNVSDPCNMNIRISAGRFMSIGDIISEQEIELADLKKKIIADKNNLLFGFTTKEAVLERFEDMKYGISSATSLLHEYIREYNDITDDKDNIERLNGLASETFVIINSIKESMAKFDTTQNTQFVIDAVSMNVNDLVPKLNEIMSLKYKSSHVFFDEDNNTYHLIQEARTIESMVIDIIEPEVITFNMNPSVEKAPSKVPATKALPAKMQTIEAPKKNIIIESSSSSA